ncbi:MAG: hypothetical protein ABIH26_14985 [Candidatus Eisenbacteria bacterium]
MSTVKRRNAFPFLALVLPLLLACAAAPPSEGVDSEAGSKGARSGREETPEPDADSPFLETLQVNKNGVVTTDIDTYYVRNIRFNTGHGFGSSEALVGYFLNTRYEIKKRFIKQIRVLGRISSSEALSVPHKFDMIEDKDLDYTFRTEIRKTEGETIEFIVRINQIGGELQEGGPFLLTGDELQALRKIVFY